MIMSTCFIHARFILYCFDARLVLHQYWFACSSGSRNTPVGPSNQGKLVIFTYILKLGPG